MKLNLFLVAIILIGCYSCKIGEGVKPYKTQPMLPLYFDICNNRKDCSTEYLRSINIFWYEAGQKLYENDSTIKYDRPLLDVWYLPVSVDSVSNTAIIDSTKPLLRSGSIFSTCVTQGVHFFYLEYPDQSTDTLYLDYLNGFDSTNEIYYSYVLKTITVNGKTPSVDSNYLKYYPSPVYKIN